MQQILLTIIITVLLTNSYSTLSLAKTYYSDPCISKGQQGVCKTWSDCPYIETLIKLGEYTVKEVVNCGFEGTGSNGEIICCPLDKSQFRKPPNNDDRSNTTPKTTTTRTISVNDTRPAVQACNVLESGLFAFLTPHILGGIPSEWGEFPHMAAIGYSSVGEEGPPYEVKCGGTLISSRFILTAAHCVSRRYEIPKVVLLGVVNFTDPEQMQFLVQLAIKKTIIHDDYRLGSSYNDIALLELESRVEFTSYIYPSCLYTKPNDPLQSDILYVTGWGVINLTTRASSDVLLKARLKITPLDECDKRLREYGLPRQLDRGVPKSLMCAWDKNLQKDACQGDSGGPLNLQIDESTRNYRVVGIVISGFECASTTPGLYTRVSEYLDFIEKHVWPNREYDNADVEKFKQKNIKL